MNFAQQATTTRNPQGSGIGAAICTGFAALWAITGVAAWSTVVASAVYLVTGLVTVSLMLGCLALIRISRHVQGVMAPAAAPRRYGWFAVVVVIEVVAINVIVGELTVHHLDAYRMPAVALIVGLHFFPLARIFAMPHYLLTGTLMTGGSVLGIALLAAGYDARLCNTAVDFVCAITLWATTLLTLRRWRRVTRRTR